MTAAKPTSDKAVVKALASQDELTSAEIATATGLGRSTIGKTLAGLERSGVACRIPGGHEGARRLPDRRSVGSNDERFSAGRRLSGCARIHSTSPSASRRVAVDFPVPSDPHTAIKRPEADVFPERAAWLRSHLLSRALRGERS
ncbi:MAG: hypothetical protein QOD71_2458 [Thermoleophilaceae bacterium]|jgi:hypothetical protein|nr:hypothetical protein [Solirubrobacteraceae bacterium]MEA2363313.1 hypothetical protein [Thermoleophilaceae bacterium]MEA2395267.1 hypothetical protein [Solirubrobacteraceae bacterium]